MNTVRVDFIVDQLKIKDVEDTSNLTVTYFSTCVLSKRFFHKSMSDDIGLLMTRK